MGTDDEDTRPDLEPAGAEPIDEIVARYADRLNAGEILDRSAVRSEQPDLADEILARLDAFAALGPGDDEPALGNLGDYTLLRQIGRGGMGIVYEAWEEALERRVAVKVLPAGFAADDRMFQRFLREARAAGKLNHPNIVPIFATGIREHTPYYAMELVAGETLAQILRRAVEAPGGGATPFGRVRDEQAYFFNLARAFAEVADGLQHAHSNGVVHRDIKPSNLMLQRAPGGGPENARLRIVDFGLARMEGQESVTASGDFLGTPYYMSPEQARRQKVTVDHRTDIYSLGATLYEAIALEPPFRGKDPQDTLSQIIEREPVDPRKLNLSVPRDLETIVLKCLRKVTLDRYGTAEALAQDLRRFVRGAPIEARSLSGAERIVRRLSRNKGRILRWAILCLLAAGCAALTIRFLLEVNARRAGEFRRAVLTEKVKLLRSRLTLTGEKAELRRLDQEDLFLFLPTDIELFPHARRLGEEAVRRLSDLVREEPASPEAHYYLAQALLIAGDREEARRQARQSLERDPSFLPARILEDELAGREDLSGTKEWLGGIPGGRWQALWFQAHLAAAKKDWSAAEGAWGELIEYEREREPAYLGSALDARLGRALARMEGGDLPGTLEDFAVAHELWPDLLEPALLLGKVLYLLDSKDRSARAFERALLLSRPESRQEVAVWVAAVYFSLGDHERCRQWAEAKVDAEPIRERIKAYSYVLELRIEEAIAAAREAVRKDPGDIRSLHILAWMTYWRHGFRGSAERRDELNEVIRVSEEALRIDPRYAPALAIRGVALQELGEVEEAIRSCREAAGIDPLRYEVLDLVLLVFAREGRLDDLSRYCERLEARFDDLTTRAKSYVIANRAYIRQLEGKYDEALAGYEKSWTLYPASWWAWFMADVLRRQGDLPRAIEWWRKGIASATPRPFKDGLYDAIVQAYEQLGDPAAAVNARCEAISSVPEHAWSHWNLVQLLRRHGDRAVVPELEALLARLEGIADSGEAQAFQLTTIAFLRLNLPAARDEGLARAAIARALAKDEDRVPPALAIQAELERSSGNLGAAIRLLEEAVRHRWAERYQQALLEDWRKEAFPTLASFDSVDAALADRPPEDDAGLPAGLEPSGEGVETYLEGRLLERAGNPLEAARRFAALVEAGATGPKPLLRLAECLRAAGDTARAERVLRDAIAGCPPDARNLWEAWAVFAIDVLGIEGAFAAFPGKEGERCAGDEAEAILWLLGELGARRPIRINCGGGEYRDHKGLVWGPDRFFLGGGASGVGGKQRFIEGTPDRPLHQMFRSFAPEVLHRGYRLPLPRGSYRVTIHSWKSRLGPCGPMASVVIEGRPAFEIEACYGPGELHEVVEAASSSATAKVEDGLLEIAFECEGWVRISAIEIELVE